MHLKKLKTYLLVIPLLFLLSPPLLYGQASGIITDVGGDATNITICDGDSVTFTLDESGAVSDGYRFIRERGGREEMIVFNSTDRVFTIPGNYRGIDWDIMNGDIFYGIIYDYDPPSTTIISDAITVRILSTVSTETFDGGIIEQTDRFVCSNFLGDTLTVSTTTSGIAFVYQWEQSIDGGITFTDIPGATLEDYYTGQLTQTTLFRRRVQNSSGGTCVRYSSIYRNVVSDLDPGNLGVNRVICYGDLPGDIGGANGGGVVPSASSGNVSYTWEQSTFGLFWTLIPGEFNPVYTPPNLTQTRYYRRTATHTNPAIGTGSCAMTTPVLQVEVSPQINPGTITSDQTICNGEIPSSLQVTGASSGPNVFYQWQSSLNGVIFSDIVSATGTNLTFTASTSDTPIFTTYYRLRIDTTTPTICSIYSSVTSITVLPENVTFSTSAQNGVYCSGDDIILSASASNSLYEFFVDGVSIARQNSPTYVLSGLRGDHVISLVAETMNGCMRQIDLNLTENVLDGGSIAGDQIVCEGMGFQEITSTISATAGGVDIDLVPGAIYQWQSSTDGGLTWSNVLGATDKSYLPPNSLTVNTSFRRVVTNTVSGVICEDFSNTVLVQVINSIRGGIGTLTEQIICLGDNSLPLEVTGSTSGTGYFYQWQQAPYSGGTFMDIPGAIGATYVPTSVTTSTRYRRRVYSSVATTCFDYSTVQSVILLNLNPGSLDTSLNQTICYNTSPGTLGTGSSIPATTSVGVVNYQWQQNTGSGWINIPGEVNGFYTPPHLTISTQFRRLAIGLAGSRTCSASTNSISINVEIQIVSGTVTKSQIICEDEIPSPLQLIGATSGSRIRYQWQHSADGFNFSDIASATTNILTFTPTSTYRPTSTTYYRVRTGIVSTTCESYSNTATITVFSENISLSTSAVNNVFCSGETIEFYIGGDINMHSLVVDGVTRIANSTSTTLSISGLTGSPTISLVAETVNGCMRQIDINLTENVLDGGRITGDQIVCEGMGFQEITSTISATAGGVDIDFIPGAIYQWQSSIDGGSTWNDVLAATDKSYLPPSSLAVDTSFRRVVTNSVSGVICQDFSNTVLVQVINSIRGGIGTLTEQIVCLGNAPPTLEITGSSSGTNFSYQWQQAPYSGGTFMDILGATGATYTPTSVTTSTRYRRRVYSSVATTCFEYSSVQSVIVLELNPGSLDPTQGGTLLYNETPPPIGNGPTGSSATASIGLISYEWELSTDGGSIWTPISNSNLETYFPPPLFVNTQFRRRALSTHGGMSCDKVTNEISFLVMDVQPGQVEQDQVICLGNLPNDLILTGASAGANISYRWEISLDGTTFNSISNTTTQLTFFSGAPWNPTQGSTTYYRVRLFESTSGNSYVSQSSSITVRTNGLTLTSDAVGNSFCVGDTISFTASGTQEYEFYVNGSLIQTRSTSNTLSIALNEDSTISVTGYDSVCGETLELNLAANVVDGGTITGPTEVCFGNSIDLISVVSGSVLGSPAGSGNGFYQWQESTDRVNWFNIPGALLSNYTYNSLTENTFFRRNTINDFNSLRCTDSSNIIFVRVNPFIQQEIGNPLNQSQCDGQEIRPIRFSHGGGAIGISVTGLPNGIDYVVTGDSIIISGLLNVNNTESQTYPFTVSAGSDLCTTNDSVSGSITVIARPDINESYIASNDLTHVSCSGSFNGSIRIPDLSPEFDFRITGNLNPIRQEDELEFLNAPSLSDIYTIEIDGVVYDHTVIPVSLGGPIQTERDVAQAILDEINNATGDRLASVIASLQNSTTLLLSAKEPGVPFTVNQAIVQSTGFSTASVHHRVVTANFTSQYHYTWRGPNGFGSTDLSIENLEAGDYTLSVQVDNCSIASATFTIEQPDPILVNTAMCNGVLQVEVSGGIAPYTINLFDSNSILIETITTNNARIFPNLTPGSNYRIEVFDSVCDLAVQQAINLPFELYLNQSGVTVVEDYCNDSEGSGFIELGGNAGGEAFSGGSGQFTYRWTGPSFTASSRDIYNLEPGLYTVTVTDEVLGCTDQAVFEVGSVDPLVINLDPSIDLDATGAIVLACEGDEDAAIEISVNGGLGNYSYSWTRNGNVIAGATGLRIADLGIGRYEVTVTDTPPSGTAPNLPNCQVTRIFEVKSPQQISVFVSSSTGSTTMYCPEENRSAAFEVEIFGGTPPFTVELTAENGSISTHSVPSNSPTTLDGLRPEVDGETYQVNVIDSNLCESQRASTTLNFQSIESVTLRPQVTQIDCSRGILGSISLDLVNGQISNPEQVQIQWRSANANIYDTWSNSNGVLENIETGGTYQVIVTQGSCELFRADDIQVTDVVEQMLFINNINVQSGGCNGDLGRIELDLRGGFPPVQIEWEQYRVVNSTTGATSTTTGSTTSRLEWVTLPQYRNNAIATDLEVGTYRARISDGANTVAGVACGGPQTTNPIAIGASAFELANFRIENGTVCDTASATASIYFTVLNTLPNTNNNEFTPKVMLDAKELGSDLISLGGDNYRIVNIGSGNHTLNITTGTSTTVLGSYANCSINHPFEIESPLPIRYGGATQFDLDACAVFTQISVDPALVTGGAPYQIDGNVFYDYSWSYTPFSDEDPTLIPQTYVGDTIFDASPGTYQLTISDSANCSSEPIVFVLNASDSTDPFSIEGILQRVSTEGSDTEIDQVKVLPPNCMSTQSNGQIGIEISGGLRPYTIEWYKEEIQPETATASSSVELVRLEGATNSTHLQNLEPGKYQLVIRSQNQECSQNIQINSNNYYEEFFVVPNNEELYIIDGPNIGDVDLCRLSPGIITVQVFDNLNSDLSFYYNNELVNPTQDPPTEGTTYNLVIENPVPYAELLISNERGCSVSTLVEIAEIAAPEFDYTSPSIRASGTILAREEIVFENNSPLPYSYSIWHFGDGSSERVNSNTLSPTTHAYGISGTYYVTLRNYNSLGCFEETTQEIIVGKGYNVIAPNAFSPNGDGINDLYRPLFSGFARVVLRIYDDRGNVLYTEEVKESDSTEITGIQLEGWNGQNAPQSPYYIYHFTGYLITDETEIIRTGTFVIIK
jgi:hypothetical protein